MLVLFIAVVDAPDWSQFRLLELKTLLLIKPVYPQLRSIITYSLSIARCVFAIGAGLAWEGRITSRTKDCESLFSIVYDGWNMLLLARQRRHREIQHLDVCRMGSRGASLVSL